MLPRQFMLSIVARALLTCNGECKIRVEKMGDCRFGSAPMLARVQDCSFSSASRADSLGGIDSSYELILETVVSLLSLFLFEELRDLAFTASRCSVNDGISSGF